MKKYFVYELKKSLFAIGCITLIATIIYLSGILLNSNHITVSNRLTPYITYLWIISGIGGVTAVAVPIWIFAYRTKRRSADLYYSLPISHKKILVVKFLIGLIAVFASYTIAYWFGAFIYIGLAFNKINAVFYIPQYFASIFPIYIIYAMSSFAFTRANRVVDGIFFIIFWALAVTVFVSVLEYLTKYSVDIPHIDDYGYEYTTKMYFNDNCIYSDYFLPFEPLDWMTSHFQWHLISNEVVHNDYNTNELINLIVGFSLTGLQGIGATVGLFLLENKTKAENASQISESWFGYKVMIPYYIVALIGLFTDLTYFTAYIYIIMIVAAAYILSAIYRHSLLIGKKQLIILAASTAAGILLSFLCSF